MCEYWLTPVARSYAVVRMRKALPEPLKERAIFSHARIAYPTGLCYLFPPNRTAGWNFSRMRCVSSEGTYSVPSGVSILRTISSTAFLSDLLGSRKRPTFVGIVMSGSRPGMSSATEIELSACSRLNSSVSSVEDGGSGCAACC